MTKVVINNPGSTELNVISEEAVHSRLLVSLKSREGASGAGTQVSEKEVLAGSCWDLRAGQTGSGLQGSGKLYAACSLSNRKALPHPGLGALLGNRSLTGSKRETHKKQQKQILVSSSSAPCWQSPSEPSGNAYS